MFEMDLEVEREILNIPRLPKKKKEKKGEKKKIKKKPQMICSPGASAIIRELYKRDKSRRHKPKWLS